jgi:translation initiation factor IF-3
VRVISNDGEQLGILSLTEALQIAAEKGMDLVEVAGASRPPVCKIMDYGKYKYTQKKKQQESKRRQHSQQMKEVKLRPKTEEHDYQFKLKHITRFLLDANKVKVTIRFRGREMAHKDIGKEMLNRIAEDVSELGVITSPPSLEGRLLHMVLAPSPKALVLKRAKDEERISKEKEAKSVKGKDDTDTEEDDLNTEEDDLIEDEELDASDTDE